MSVKRALEIEKLVPIENGIYICVNPSRKEYKLVQLKDIPIIIDGKQILLGEHLKNLENQQENMLKEFNSFKQDIAKKYNDLLATFKKYVIIESVNKLGGKK